MIRQLGSLTLAALVAAAITTPRADAIAIVEVFSEAEAAGNVVNPFLDTVAVSDTGIAYSVVREFDGGGAAPGAGEIVAFDGATFTTVSTIAQWQASAAASDPAGIEGAAVVDGKLRAISSLESLVYEVDLTSGAVTVVLSDADIETALGGSTSSLPADFEVTPSGDIYAVESQADRIIKIAADNTVSVEIDPTTFNSILGGVSFGGLGVDGDLLYLGSNSSDEIVAWNTTTNGIAFTIDTASIDSVTDDVDGRVGFGDIFAAPDGLVYFYESDADAILTFDPSAPVPASTVSVFVTEAQLLADTGDDSPNQLSWWNDSLAFTHSSRGFYSVIPEPASALLAAIAACGLGFARRR